MSVRVLSKVWDGFPGGGSDLLAMLALADWSDDLGHCWPSIAAVSHKTRLSRSQAQRVLHGLIDSGFLAVVGNENGGAPGSTRQYRINLESLTGRMGATGSANATGRTDAQEGSHGRTETGRMGATQTVIDPSLTVKEDAQERTSAPAGGKRKRGTTAKQTLREFIEACKAKGEKPIPEDDAIYAYAEKVGVSDDMLYACWREFLNCHLDDATKKQKDWRAHYRNAVRRNWYGLWYLKTNEMAQWTTAGEQARRAAA